MRRYADTRRWSGFAGGRTKGGFSLGGGGLGRGMGLSRSGESGLPSEPSEAGPMGSGGARERVEFSPEAETEQSGLCDDEDEEAKAELYHEQARVLRKENGHGDHEGSQGAGGE